MRHATFVSPTVERSFLATEFLVLVALGLKCAFERDRYGLSRQNATKIGAHRDREVTPSNNLRDVKELVN
jgi:hypothetical protein